MAHAVPLDDHLQRKLALVVGELIKILALVVLAAGTTGRKDCSSAPRRSCVQRQARLQRRTLVQPRALLQG
jgi:hypothetical protein